MLQVFLWLVLFTSSAYSQVTDNTCSPNTDYTWYAPHSDDCLQYNLCRNGLVSITRSCLTPGLEFDIFSLQCKTGATCYIKTDVTCAKLPGRSRIPTPNTCRQFIDCDNGETLGTCPQDKPFFDYNSMECREESNVFCYPMSSKDEIDTPGDDDINTCLPNTGFTQSFPHPTECTKSCKCVNGQHTGDETCPATESFDYLRLTCLPTDEAWCYPGKNLVCPGAPAPVILPHPDDCRKYLDCSASPAAQEKTCDDQTPFFHYQLNKCVPEKEVLCYPGTTKSPTPGISECGGIVRGSSGTISYKPTEAIQQDERCVWIIETPGASHFQVTLDSPVSLNTPSGVMAVTVHHEIGQNAHVVPVKLTESGKPDTLPGNVLMIILHTKDGVPPHGIEVYYEAISDDTTSYRQSHALITGTSFKYPTGTGNYANNEASLFVYAPSSIQPTTFKVSVDFKDNGLQQCCDCDRLWVMKFDPVTLIPEWEFPQLCYSPATGTRLYDEMVAYYFETDGSIVGTGFTLDLSLTP